MNSTLQLFEPQPGRLYSIDIVARLAQVPRRRVLVYCKHGLVSPVSEAELGGYYFDAEAIRALRRIEFLRADCEINLPGIKLIVALTEEINRLKRVNTNARFPRSLNSSGGDAGRISAIPKQRAKSK